LSFRLSKSNGWSQNKNISPSLRRSSHERRDRLPSQGTELTALDGECRDAVVQALAMVRMSAMLQARAAGYERADADLQREVEKRREARRAALAAHGGDAAAANVRRMTLAANLKRRALLRSIFELFDTDREVCAMNKR